MERKHQHLLNVARALFFQSRVPLCFWGDCLQTATFLVNRTPMAVLKNQSPYMVLYEKEPNYFSFRAFGCLAFASTFPSTRDKFSPQAVPTIFMGYPLGYKGYRLYNIQTRKFLISRDVVFYEDIFPFHTVSPNFQDCDMFYDVVCPLPCRDLNVDDGPRLNTDIRRGDSSATNTAPAAVPSDVISLRRSTRPHRPPSYL